MRRSYLLFSLAVLFLSCGTIDRTIENITEDEIKLLSEFENLPNSASLQITKDSEPGEKLTLCLTFVNKEDKIPLRNQKTLLYHTSEDGEYRPENPSDETTARLRAIGFTDDNGRLFVKTILPGDYGSSADNRHIHMSVFGARPEAYDINFKQYSGSAGTRFINGSDQHFLAELKYTSNKELICFVTIEVKRPTIN